MISVSCPQCGAKYNLDDEWIGRRVQCSECFSKFDIYVQQGMGGPQQPQFQQPQFGQPQFDQPQFQQPQFGQPQFQQPQFGRPQFQQPQFQQPQFQQPQFGQPQFQQPQFQQPQFVEPQFQQPQFVQPQFQQPQFEQPEYQQTTDFQQTEYPQTEQTTEPPPAYDAYESQSVDPSVEYNQGPSVWITCPHCWQKFDFKDIFYISRHLDLLGDPVLGADAQKRFLPVKFSARGMAIDEKGMECPEMACPHCHLKIPESIVDLPSSIFSIVGAPSSGKSYLLTTMLWQVRKCLPHYFEFNIGDVDSSFNEVLNKYESILFMNNHPDSLVSLPKTELQGSGYTNQIMMNGFPVDLPKPFIFALTPMPGHPRFETDRKELERNIILYDNAGEHFQPGHESVNNLATNHLAFSDGIIFVYDPLRDSHMQKYCDENDPQFQQESANQLALFYEMASRVRKFSGLQTTDKYRQPLIVAIAKFDVLRKSLGINPGNDDYLGYDDARMEYSLNLQNITNMSFLLREKLLEIAPEFVAAAEGFSETVYFVPVSSFGCSPKKISHPDQSEDDGRKQALGIIPNEMNPFWAEVPFLLHLYLHGLLSAMTPPIPEAEPLSQYKFSQDTIIFSFPGVRHRFELPRIYYGMSLYCAETNKYYTLPLPDEGEVKGNSHKATSLDEQIDTDFWSKQ